MDNIQAKATSAKRRRLFIKFDCLPGRNTSWVGRGREGNLKGCLGLAQRHMNHNMLKGWHSLQINAASEWSFSGPALVKAEGGRQLPVAYFAAANDNVAVASCTVCAVAASCAAATGSVRRCACRKQNVAHCGQPGTDGRTDRRNSWGNNEAAKEQQ